VIRTLGATAIWIESQPIHERISSKAQAVLIYLACRREVYSREVLAEFFWPERPQSQSLANLRKVVGQLRQAIGPYLSITRQTIGIDPAYDIRLDVEMFEAELAAVERADEGVLMEHLRRAVDLYKGDFLDGFFVDSPAFEDWALLERERLHFRAISTLDTLAELCIQQNQYHHAQRYISRLLEIDPLREKTYYEAMRLFSLSGEREGAIFHYQTCQRVLGEELGITPAAETVALYQQIRDGIKARQSHPVDVPTPETRIITNLPAQSTAFIGRETQMSELLRYLEDDNCRLVTIVGPGGIGKTRLALELARQALSLFPDGVFFVSLAGVKRANAMVPAILKALNLQVQEGAHDLTAYLLDHLAEKAMLLVLDNMEHLVHDLTAIQEIHAAAPGVKVLVTSRQALNLSWEWQFPLDGMNVPVSTTVEKADTYSGVRLFVERARHVQPGFSFADDPEGVIRICQLVEGMPLGIELAAAWLRVLSSNAIAENLFELETFQEPVEDRHRSLRTLFENTWQRLSSQEQLALMRLSIFRGGFRASAAEAVAQLPLPQLATLVHKSLIQTDFHSGRFDIHQLLIQFAHQKLSQQPDEEQRTLERHAAYFAAFLQQRETALQRAGAKATITEIQDEIDNIRAAWSWSVDHGRLDLAAQASGSLGVFYGLKSLHHETLSVFGSALTALSAAPESPERDAQELAFLKPLQRASVIVHGWTSGKVLPVCERIRALAEKLGRDRELFDSLTLLATYYGSEDWNEALRMGEQAGEVARRLNQVPLLVSHAHVMDTIMFFIGNFLEALEQTRRALHLFDPVADWSQTTLAGLDIPASVMSQAGYIQCMMGYIQEGEQTLCTALDRARILESPAVEVFARGFHVLVYDLMREPDRQLAHLEALEALAIEHRYQHWLLLLPGFIGSRLIQQGDYQADMDIILPGLEKQHAHKLYHIVPLRRAQLALDYTTTGRPDRAFGEIEQALNMIERTGERQHEAEVHRLHGDVLFLLGDEAGAAQWFEQAIDVAQKQQARMLQLRATMSLARLWQGHEYAATAHQCLSAITGWFPAEVNTRDLTHARAMLADIAPRAP
jgi:DNA-binding SARP family transcriptional activator/predicted ATPase